MKSDINYCIDSIGIAPLLTADEEKELFSRIGEPGVRDKLILSNRRLVLAMAKKIWWKNPTTSLADLIQEGCTGLAKAVDCYKWGRGARFATWAHRLIGHSLNAYLMQINGHHVTRRAYLALSAAGGSYTTPQEIDEAVAEGRVAVGCGRIAKQALLASHDTGDRPLAFIEVHDAGLDKAEVADDIRRMQEAVKTLFAREQEVLRLAYSEGMPNREIADVFGVSGARVQQIRTEVIKKLRSKLLPSEENGHDTARRKRCSRRRTTRPKRDGDVNHTASE